MKDILDVGPPLDRLRIRSVEQTGSNETLVWLDVQWLYFDVVDY